MRKVALFGARVTLETQMFGIATTYARIVEAGRASEADYQQLRALAHTLIERENLDAIVLAGTDPAFVFDQANTDFPHVDGARLHVAQLCGKFFG